MADLTDAGSPPGVAADADGRGAPVRVAAGRPAAALRDSHVSSRAASASGARPGESCERCRPLSRPSVTVADRRRLRMKTELRRPPRGTADRADRQPADSAQPPESAHLRATDHRRPRPLACQRVDLTTVRLPAAQRTSGAVRPWLPARSTDSADLSGVSDHRPCSIAARPASSRATGTRNGEQDT